MVNYNHIEYRILVTCFLASIKNFGHAKRHAGAVPLVLLNEEVILNTGYSKFYIEYMASKASVVIDNIPSGEGILSMVWCTCYRGTKICCNSESFTTNYFSSINN